MSEVTSCGPSLQWNISIAYSTKVLALQQFCNEDWKWTKEEDEESLNSENKYLKNLGKPSKIEISSKILEELKVFCKDIKENLQNYSSLKNFWIWSS